MLENEVGLDFSFIKELGLKVRCEILKKQLTHMFSYVQFNSAECDLTVVSSGIKGDMVSNTINIKMQIHIFINLKGPSPKRKGKHRGSKLYI